MENETVLPETPTLDEELNLDQQPTEDVEKLRETNKKLYERAKKAEAEAKALKANPPITSKKETPSGGIKPSDILRSEEFALHREGYNEDEIDLIMRNGGRAILKDEKNPLVLGLRASKEQRKAEEAAAKAQDTSGLSDVERKYSEADLRKMSVADLEKILPHAN